MTYGDKSNPMNWGYHIPLRGIMKGALKASKEECLDKFKENLDNAFKDAVTIPVVPHESNITFESAQEAMKEFERPKTIISYSDFKMHLIRDISQTLSMDLSVSLDDFNYLKYMPTREVSFAPIETNDGYGYSYLYMVMSYMDKFGKLPCGKSQRSRIKKKRKKKIMKWFEEKNCGAS